MKRHLHMDLIRVVLHCFKLLAACQKAGGKVRTRVRLAGGKKGMFDEDAQTQADCIFQWVTNKTHMQL